MVCTLIDITGGGGSLSVYGQLWMLIVVLMVVWWWVLVAMDRMVVVWGTCHH